MTHKILVVDDDDEIRELLCEVLSDEGYTAVSLVNGREALEALHSSPAPCMMLLDLMMPVVDGWEVLRQRSADPVLARIPVVVITANGAIAEGLSADLVLHKPFAVERVLAAVRQFC